MYSQVPLHVKRIVGISPLKGDWLPPSLDDGFFREKPARHLVVAMSTQQGNRLWVMLLRQREGRINMLILRNGCATRYAPEATLLSNLPPYRIRNVTGEAILILLFASRHVSLHLLGNSCISAT